ncbi:MAG: hypothetical protein WBG51_10705 [Syntrophobacteria bacterium]
MFHESPAATTDMEVLPGVLGCWPLRRTGQVRLETNTLRLSGGTTIFVVSRRQFMKHPGEGHKSMGKEKRVEDRS